MKQGRAGSKIGVSGKIHTFNYETEDGQKRQDVTVVANNIEYLEAKKNEENIFPQK